MYEAILRQITDAHGYTNWSGSHSGQCRNARGSNSLRRATSFSIYNHCSWGSRNTYTTPRNMGPYVGSTLRIKKPDGEYYNIRFSGRGGHNLSPPRTVRNNSVRTVRTNGTQGHTVLQFTTRSMFMLFDIERCQDPETVLLDLYEAFVMPLTEDRYATNMRVADWDEAPAGHILPATARTPRTTRTTRTPRRTIGEDITWRYNKDNLPATVPAESSTTEVVAQMKNHRRRTLGKQIVTAEAEKREQDYLYKESLKELHRHRERLVEKENELEALKSYQAGGSDVSLDDPEVNALSEAIEMISVG